VKVHNLLPNHGRLLIFVWYNISYDIRGRKGEVLFVSSVSDNSLQDIVSNQDILNNKIISDAQRSDVIR
jgi:hypothetical protein